MTRDPRTPADGRNVILLVEDNPPLRSELAELLQEDGHQVVTAAHGLAALEQLRWGLRPCVILLDLRMNVMTGWEFRAQQKTDPSIAFIPVVAMTTGKWKPEDTTDFAALIPKPIDIELLREVLARYCPPVAPRSRPTDATAGTTRSIAGPDHRRTTSLPILVAEDNPDFRKALQELLESAGYGVMAAQDGRQALEALKGSPQPALILLDLMMPVMDGWQFLAAQRADPRLSRVPVVILSALGHQSQSRTLGAAAVLSKPVDAARLLEVVKAHYPTAVRRDTAPAPAERLREEP